ncbi:cob(I)yrinic acid a,c-diamide adenosyltransferase [bacterium]|nr:cob(I)yrinic acid a,c-diamide adenosyltransferase [bacterium]
MNREKSLIIIYIGSGKGKTTAALGLAARFMGNNLKVCICQFIKSNTDTGEYKFFKNMGELAQIHMFGKGFVFERIIEKDRKKHCEIFNNGLKFIEKKIRSGKYNLIIADEILDVLSLGFFSVDDIIRLKQILPEGSHLVLTGRTAPEELIELADTVTQMKEIKHHYHQGVKALKGIEY